VPIRDILITAVILGTVPAILRNPYWGVLVWNWLAFMSPHRLAWGFAYASRFSLIIALTTLFSFIIHHNRRKILWNASVVFMFFLTAWVSVTTVFALNAAGAFQAWIEFIKIILMLLITMAVIDTHQKLDRLIWVICLSLGFYGVKGGIFTLAHGGIYSVTGPPGTMIEGNNELALALIMTLPLMRYLQLRTSRKAVSLALWAAMSLTSICILGSYSRGAFLAGGAMALFLAMKSRKRISIIIVLAVLIPALLTFMPARWHQRMGSIQNYQQDASALGRINAWEFAWNLAKDHPFLGGGARAFVPALFYKYAPDPNNYHDAHSIYFEMMAEQGFVGLALFVGIAMGASLSARTIQRRSKGKPPLLWAFDLAGMCQTTILGFAVGGAFLGLSYWDLPYTVVAIVALCANLVNTELTRIETDTIPNSKASEVPEAVSLS
jgi:putative inorganic carbon (hco3(-)) transporter